MMVLRLLVALPLLVLAIHSAFGQDAEPLPVTEAFGLSAESGPKGVLLDFDVTGGYYLYRDKITVSDAAGDLLALDLPAGRVTDDPTFGRTETLWDDFRVALPAEAEGALAVSYQGCMDGSICYPPVTRTLDLASLKLSAPGFGFLGGTASPAAAPIAIASDTGGSLLTDLAGRGGVLLVLGGFLLLGVALAFTPCVFPMYPILAGTLTQAGKNLSTPRAFSISLTYVLGMAGAFALLGIAAAWSGQNLQMALQSPIAVWSVAILFAALATSMFGAFEIQLPSSWMTFMSRRAGQGGGLAGAGVMGFLSALIVGPCVTAPLAAALIYIAQTGDAALGAASLFALGLGKGIPLVVFGTIGGRALPRAGAWMERVKHGFGFVFIAAAIWTVERVLPNALALALWATLAIAIAAYAFLALPRLRGRARLASSTFGAAALVYGGLLGLGAATGASDPLSPWSGLFGGDAVNQTRTLNATGLDGLQQAINDTSGEPRLVYFTADWCISCAVIEREIWGNPEAMAGLGDTSVIKLDVSANRPEDQQLMATLEVYGPPTVLYVNAGASEVEGTRLIGEFGVEDFRARATTAGMLR